MEQNIISQIGTSRPQDSYWRRTSTNLNGLRPANAQIVELVIEHLVCQLVMLIVGLAESPWDFSHHSPFCWVYSGYRSSPFVYRTHPFVSAIRSLKRFYSYPSLVPHPTIPTGADIYLTASKYRNPPFNSHARVATLAPNVNHRPR
jgi:hypothetical protein